MHKTNTSIHENLSVSFIIPTLNEATMLPKLIASIKALEYSQTIQTLEIIIVDANSSDGTPELAIEQGCKVVKAKPGIVSVSRNIGANKAAGNLLAFIDADCELPSDWLLAVESELQDPQVIAAGSVMAKNPTANTWVEKAWFELAHKQHKPSQANDAEWLASFNLAIKQDTFHKAGGFDETLTTCEDVEFGYRLSKEGKLRQINSSAVIHNGESKTVREFYQREAWRAHGATNILSKHWKNPREVLSFLLPLGIACGLIFSCILMIFSLMQASVSSATLAMIIVTGPLPILLLTLRRRIAPSMFAPCSLLMVIYFYARAHGTLRAVRRVER